MKLHEQILLYITAVSVLLDNIGTVTHAFTK